jgi:hypothetical protein
VVAGAGWLSHTSSPWLSFLLWSSSSPSSLSLPSSSLFLLSLQSCPSLLYGAGSPWYPGAHQHRRRLLAPAIHPASSGSQGWGRVLGCSLSSGLQAHSCGGGWGGGGRVSVTRHAYGWLLGAYLVGIPLLGSLSVPLHTSSPCRHSHPV